MSDKEIYKLVFRLVVHNGVETTAGYLKMNAIEEAHRVYKQERRDCNDPYAFIEFCVSRFNAEVIKYSSKMRNVITYSFIEGD